MTESFTNIVFALVVVIVTLLFVGFARNANARNDRAEETAGAEPAVGKYQPQHIGLTKMAQVAENLLAGDYQGETLYQVIQYVKMSGYRFFANRDLSGLKRPIRADGWTLAHELARVGYEFDVAELRAIGNPADSNGITVAHVMTSLGHKFGFPDLIALDNPVIENGESIANEMVEQGVAFTFEEIVRLNNPKDEWGGTLAHQMAMRGYKFSVDQILTLGDGSDLKGVTISLLMARNGHPFSVDEINLLGNPADKFGATIGHWMARWGHSFNTEEIMRLGNPVIAYQQDDLVWYNNLDDRNHDLDEELDYQDKRELFHNGASIAHIMAREGHRFTTEEIAALGNPKDVKGLTIADWMARAENPLSAENMQRLQ